jgi:O-acetyl-ADP-ribose deacetylase (regulator of RNase III)
VHRIKIYQGKIATLNVEAVVSSPAYGAAFETLAVASGDGLVPLRVGDVQVVSEAYKDLYQQTNQMLIQAVGPRWRGGEHQEEEQLADCYSKAMGLAKQYNLRSIAFTPISCGPMGFPANRAIKVAIQQVTLGLRRNPLIESVIFCCFDPVTTALYRSHLGK